MKDSSDHNPEPELEDYVASKTETEPASGRNYMDSNIQENCEINLEDSNSEKAEQELLDCILLLTSEGDSNILNLESPSKEEEESENETNAAEPLYEGAQISLHDSYVAILTFYLSFKLTGVSLQALLHLISLHLPKVTIFKKSIEFFKNYFSYMQGEKEFEYYCSVCFKKLLNSTKCKDCKNGKVCCLVKLSLIQQLCTLLKRKGFWRLLQFPKYCGLVSAFSDVTDGQLYQDLLKIGLLGNGDTITFQWYTDGAALYSSSSTSVWPLYLNINELPYVERYKKDNLLVPAIWVGPVKPPGSLLVSAVYPDLNLLQSGVNFEVDGKENINLKGIVICGTGDTPGRSIMLNIVQFNGASSCQVCEDEGEPRFMCPGVRLFPYQPTDTLIPRTLEKMEAYGKQGTEENPCVGVKGPCALSKVMPDFLTGTGIDSMHQLFGGVTKKITSKFLSTKGADKKFSVAEHYKLLDERLMSIKPPAHVPRAPRPLKEVMSWKMNELKAWLLDYSIPVLYNVLPNEYFLPH
ncbi:Cathepsin S [Frankliniella fusca]|uniref:Cathepsin S n=1 Tax=Frankliniella fusca TaxID=407009 RepID=A0AAE1HVR4_9NEOP|nr:Cathepsin S [Frankliniella fusca]